MVLAACHTHSPQNTTLSNPLFKTEADSFLRHMAPGLQDRQTQAILKACEGNNAGLESVRNSRNTAPAISPNVATRMLTPTMRIYEPKSPHAEPMPVLIYLHGGGWTIGSINSCGRFCNAVAQTERAKVIAVDYRLAPEHRYPAPLDDCRAALAYIVGHSAELGVNPARITVGGDSSGGNLALATALSPESRGLIESLVVFYPVTKAFNDSSTSWKEYANGYALDGTIMEAFNRSYLGSHPATDPLVSVGLAPKHRLRHLPRTLLVAAQRDILASQGQEFAARAGDRLRRVEIEGAVHLFITVAGQDEAFNQAVRLTTEFIDEGK